MFHILGRDREPEEPRQRGWRRLSERSHRGRDAVMTDDTFPANTRRDDFAVYGRFSTADDRHRQFQKNKPTFATRE
jgi:hypothetical protein